MGIHEDLRTLASDYKANEWQFIVKAVQPGCDIDKLLRQSQSHVYHGLRTVREWLMQAGAEFLIWGSERQKNED